jgi:hypothetical protein
MARHSQELSRATEGLNHRTSGATRGLRRATLCDFSGRAGQRRVRRSQSHSTVPHGGRRSWPCKTWENQRSSTRARCLSSPPRVIDDGALGHLAHRACHPATDPMLMAVFTIAMARTTVRRSCSHTGCRHHRRPSWAVRRWLTMRNRPRGMAYRWRTFVDTACLSAWEGSPAGC